MLREDAGEIEAAEKGALPRPIRAVIGDFHVHTTVSGDGRSPLEEVVAAARARGYRVLAITDHAEGTLSGVGREALLEQRARIRALQAELGDSLRLLHGVELNIGAEGELDYDLEFRRWLRLVRGVGARPLRARSRGADAARDRGHAGPDGAHDRPSLGAHDRRRDRRSTSTSTRSSPPPRRRAPRSR